MRIGVGLPSAVPGSDGRLVLDWARRAELGPFSSLGVLDRMAYESFDPLVSLAAAGAVTRSIRLVTMVVIGPLRSAALLAKEAASVQALSGNRLTLGLAVGARQEDYDVAGVDPRGRGRLLSEQLVALHDHWEDGTSSPASGVSRPQVLIGGSAGPAFARMARYGDGYVHGGGHPRAFASAASKARAAWADLGRPGELVTWGQGYFALGDGAADPGAAYLRDYYAFTGPFAEKVAAGNLTTPTAVVEYVRGYEEAGCDEVVLLPTVPEVDQVERLGDVVARFV